MPSLRPRPPRGARRPAAAVFGLWLSGAVTAGAISRTPLAAYAATFATFAVFATFAGLALAARRARAVPPPRPGPPADPRSAEEALLALPRGRRVEVLARLDPRAPLVARARADLAAGRDAGWRALVRAVVEGRFFGVHALLSIAADPGPPGEYEALWREASPRLLN